MHILTQGADVELVGRATSGYWGLLIKDEQEPRYGIRIAVSSTGQMEIVRTIEPVRHKRQNIFGGVGNPHRSIPSWRGDGAFNLLRVLTKEGKVTVWINGVLACEPFALPDPMAAPMIALSGHTGDTRLYSEFDSLRVWRAGEGPPLLPLPANSENATASADTSGKAKPKGKPTYENDFSASTPAWPGVVQERWRSSIAAGRLHFESLGISWKACRRR